VNTKSPHIPTSFEDENTEEVNKASGINKLTTKTLRFAQKKKSTLSKKGLRKKKATRNDAKTRWKEQISSKIKATMNSVHISTNNIIN
jgi:hypothetical protein